jgi:GNAT superfamily N-acetyltransferase
LFQLYKDSYQQWQENGLESSWHNFTIEDFGRISRLVNSSSVFVALDAETGELLGAHTLRANKRTKVVSGSALAVASKAKHKGVATGLLLFEEERARKAGYYCICGATAIGAEWSVRWHLKNGYLIIGYKHSKNDNHPSYVFRKQLLPVSLKKPLYSLYSFSFFCRFCYFVSKALTYISKDSNGHFTRIGRVIKGIKEIIC